MRWLAAVALGAVVVQAVKVVPRRRVPEEEQESWEQTVDKAVHEALRPADWHDSDDVLSGNSDSGDSSDSVAPAVELRAKPANAWRGPLWFFAAHHKAGTNLLNSFARIQANSLGMMVCSGACGLNRVSFGKPCEIDDSSVSERTMFYCNTGRRDLETARRIAQGNLRAVQIVRDPIALVVSGYVYDMHNNDGMHADRSMRQMGVTDGIAVEAEFALKETLPTMLDVYNAGMEGKDVLVVHMEDFLESSASFDRTIARLYNHTMGDFASPQLIAKVCKQAMREDLHRHPEPTRSSSISPSGWKAAAKSALNKIPADLIKRLHQYREALGYSEM